MLFRTLILKLARSEALINLIAHMGRRSGLAGRFVAGENIEAAMPVVHELNDKGIVTSLNLLGEGGQRQERGGTLGPVLYFSPESDPRKKSGIEYLHQTHSTGFGNPSAGVCGALESDSRHGSCTQQLCAH